jgi:hypothetical protein
MKVRLGIAPNIKKRTKHRNYRNYIKKTKIQSLKKYIFKQKFNHE